MYRAWAQTRVNNGDDTFSVVVTALRNLLEDTKTPDEVAKSLTELCNPEGLPDNENAVGDLGPTWHLILEAAKEFPEKQNLLVEMLQAIQRIPGKPLVAYGMSMVWADLPYFGWQVRDAWYYHESEHDDPYRASKRRSWRNFNAFVARIAAAHIPYFMNFGLWSLRTALEEIPAEISHLDGHVPAAAEWMLHAGQVIFECEEERLPHPECGDPYKGGELWDGKHGFCQERWLLWKKRFRQITEMEDLSEETRRFAVEAERAMMDIDRSVLGRHETSGSNTSEIVPLGEEEESKSEQSRR